MLFMHSRGGSRFQLIRALMVPVAALFLVSCSSPRVFSSRNPALPAGVQYRSMMVVALDERPNVRADFENRLANLLNQRGVRAAASHTRFSLAEIKGDREQVRRKFAAAQVEAVLVTRMTDRASSVEGQRGHVGGLWAGEFGWSELGSARYRLFSSGGDIQTAMILESKLYRVADATVVWACVTEATLKEDFVPEDVSAVATKAIAGQLARDTVIP